MVKKQAISSKSTERRQAQRVGIFGASGSGKTTKARELARGLSRKIYFDTVHEFCRTEKSRNFSDFEQLKKAIIKDFAKGFSFVFMPTYGKWEQQLHKLCEFLVQIQTGYQTGQHNAQLTLIVDELSRAFPSGIRQRNPSHAFGFLCCMGRHYGINLIGIAQRTAQVDAEFRANLSYTFVFRQAEVIDIETCIKSLGREWAETVRKLPNYEYILKSPFGISKEK